MIFVTNYAFPARDVKKLQKKFNLVGYDEMRSCFKIIEACGTEYSYDGKVIPYKDILLNCPSPYEPVKNEPLESKTVKNEPLESKTVKNEPLESETVKNEPLESEFFIQ